MKFQITAALLVSALPFAIASADRPPHRKPPQAAFDACAKSQQGDTCSVAFGERTINGTCEAFKDSAALVCRPDHPPGPPPEAVDACSSKQEGDACTVTHEDQTLSGSCVKGRDGNGPLACRPAHPTR
jgi:hypothetical protein